MHIVGLLGMPRRDYTYAPGLGWSSLNLIETLGSYLLATGLLIIVANLAISLRRGERVGNDPFGGATLEWSVSSPPPPYNFGAIPAVSSPYPLWDEEDRKRSERRLEEGELVLEGGHRTPASTLLDGDQTSVLDMPSNSPWPITLAAVLGVVFAMLLLGQPIAAGAFIGVAAAVLVIWHAKESGVEGREL